MNINRKKPLKQYKYLTTLTMLFITVFVICDTTAYRMVEVYGKELPLSGFIIPIIFAIGDITAETYGYRITMKMLLNGIICQCVFGILITFFLWIAPSPPNNLLNQAYDLTFKHVLRVNLTSCFSVTCGMLANAFLISKLKVYMQGKRFWVRTIISCGFSELVLCTVAYLILFSGLRDFWDVIRIIYSVWVYKMVFSLFSTPLTSLIAKLLKRSENSDVYDIAISYNPFRKFDDSLVEFEERGDRKILEDTWSNNIKSNFFYFIGRKAKNEVMC